MAANLHGDVTFAWDEHAIVQLLQGPDGEVARELARIGVALESQMKLNVTDHGPSGQGPKVRTGRLRSSITWELDRDGAGLYVDAGTNVDYGRYLEEGTDRMRPHPWAGQSLQQVLG